MRGLEVIRLQTVTGRHERARDKLTEIACDVRAHRLDPGLIDAVLYRHSTVPGLFALCLWWEADTVRAARSPLGRTLARALREFGVVSHSVWVHDETAQAEAEET